MRFPHWLAVILLSSAIAGPARGATPADEAAAERLFQEAKALMTEGRVRDACSKLEEAKRLDLGGGTVLALAMCRAKEGRSASALAEFREALALAIDAKRADRVRVAEEQIARLNESVSTLTIVAREGTRVLVNHEAWDRARIGVAVPMDGGEYVVRAEAPGKIPREMPIHLGAEHDGVKLEIPPLADEEARPAVVTPGRATAEEGTRPAPDAPSPGAEGRHTRRVVGLAAGGVGIVGLAVAAVSGVVAVAKRSEADCQGHLCPDGASAYDTGRSAATVATVATIVGGAALGGGALLLLTAREPSDSTARRASIEIVPRITGSGGSIGIAGRF